LSLKLERLTMKNLNKAVAMVNVFRLHDGHKVATLVGDGWISAVALSPDSRHLAIGHVSGKVMMWEQKD
ncbi:MAG: hypothetical protein N3B10_08010, partial [Armatimonadetes bacterium]|nr:hypothetical protein [Armatimonadota bacterium]